MDNELFELCRQVYERTEWGFHDRSLIQQFFYRTRKEDPNTGELSDVIIISSSLAYKINRDRNGLPECPLYTSDYLLEKLPNWVTLNKFGGNDYKAECDPLKTWTGGLVEAKSDTPLKALLLLTIALHNQGILTNKEKA